MMKTKTRLMTLHNIFISSVNYFVVVVDKNHKLQIVGCNALPILILMLQSKDAAIHYEAVGTEINTHT